MTCNRDEKKWVKNLAVKDAVWGLGDGSNFFLLTTIKKSSYMSKICLNNCFGKQIENNLNEI